MDGMVYRYKMDDVGGEGVAQRKNFMELIYQEALSDDIDAIAAEIESASSPIPIAAISSGM